MAEVSGLFSRLRVHDRSRWAGWPRRGRWRVGLVALGLSVLGACATHDDGSGGVPAYAYGCTHGLAFQARLYKDMVVLEGGRGHDQLPRKKDGAHGSYVFGNERLTAEFGLGLRRQLATLRYVDIPDTIQCERQRVAFGDDPGGELTDLPELRVSRIEGPKPKPVLTPAERARVDSNIRFGDGPPPNSN